MSFRSCVYLSKACSIVETSVLASTTKKFFCDSGGCVTCCLSEIRWKVTDLWPIHTPIPASSKPVTESYIRVSYEVWVWVRVWRIGSAPHPRWRPESVGPYMSNSVQSFLHDGVNFSRQRETLWQCYQGILWYYYYIRIGTPGLRSFSLTNVPPMKKSTIRRWGLAHRIEL